MTRSSRAGRRTLLATLAGALGLVLFAAGADARKGGKHPPPQTAPQASPSAAEPPQTQAPPAAAAEPAPAKQPDRPLSAEEQKTAEIIAAFDAGSKASAKGPTKVGLIDQAELSIGPDQAFIPKAESLRILRALGNKPDADGLMGLVLGVKEDDNWLVVVRHVKEGYIKDDDAKNWSADELLESIREGTEETNKDRAERGFPEVEIVGWIEKPTYDPVQHRLVWSLLSKHKGDPDSDVKGVNYNTYALGRDGYFSLHLLSDSDKIEAQKPVAKTLLANLAYRPGKRYQDFNASTDQVAAYGLAALVGGVAAKKLGLFAIAAGFFAKFAKLILVGLAAAGAAIAKFFKRGDTA